MENLILSEGENTPAVEFDKQVGRFILEGRSFPENAYGFYASVLEWLENYSKGPNSTTAFIFKLEYFNTPSSKMVLDILRILERIRKNGQHVLVKWHYEEKDQDMLDAGTIYSHFLDLPFEFVVYKFD